MSLVKPIWRDAGRAVDEARMLRYMGMLEELIEVYESAEGVQVENDQYAGGISPEFFDVDTEEVARIERQIRAEG